MLDFSEMITVAQNARYVMHCGVVIIIFFSTIFVYFTINHPVLLRVVRPSARRNALVSSRRRIYLEPLGRLGNLLFQYASAMGIANSSNASVLFRNRKKEYDQVMTLFPETKKSQYTNVTLSHKDGAGEISWSKYTPKIEQTIASGNRTFYICCYLQSFKYFRKIENEIRRIFSFSLEQLESIRHFFNKIHFLSGSPSNLTYIGVHVRRGDLLQKDKYIYGHKYAPRSYFEKAMQLFRRKVRRESVVFVICGDDTKWIIKTFGQANDSYDKPMIGPDIAICYGNSAEEDFAILANCNHSIISVGSFGWWTAYLANGITVYYSDAYRINSSMWKSHKAADYFPQHWIGINPSRPTDWNNSDAEASCELAESLENIKCVLNFLQQSQ